MVEALTNSNPADQSHINGLIEQMLDESLIDFKTIELVNSKRRRINEPDSIIADFDVEEAFFLID